MQRWRTEALSYISKLKHCPTANTAELNRSLQNWNCIKNLRSETLLSAVELKLYPVLKLKLCSAQHCRTKILAAKLKLYQTLSNAVEPSSIRHYKTGALPSTAETKPLAAKLKLYQTRRSKTLSDTVKPSSIIRHYKTEALPNTAGLKPLAAKLKLYKKKSQIWNPIQRCRTLALSYITKLMHCPTLQNLNCLLQN